MVIGMGFVQRWEQLVALRAILGVLEAGFFPSSVYLLSTWYTRCECAPMGYPMTQGSNRGERSRDRQEIRSLLHRWIYCQRLLRNPGFWCKPEF